MNRSATPQEREERKYRIMALNAEYAAKAQGIRALPVSKTDLQPVVGRVRFTTAAVTGLVVEDERIALLDRLGESTAGGIVLTHADASLFGGDIPTGQLILLWSLGATIVASGLALTAQDVLDIAQDFSLHLNLRGTEVHIGAVVDWSDVLGSSGLANNGFGLLGRQTIQIPSEMEPEDPLTIIVRRQRATALSILASQFDIHFHLKATRIYDERVLALA